MISKKVVWILLPLIILAAYLFRYEPVSKCGYSSTCTIVFDRWRHRTCFAIIDRGIVCSIKNLFAEQKSETKTLPDFDDAYEQFQKEHPSSQFKSQK